MKKGKKIVPLTDLIQVVEEAEELHDKSQKKRFDAFKALDEKFFKDRSRDAVVYDANLHYDQEKKDDARMLLNVHDVLREKIVEDYPIPENPYSNDVLKYLKSLPSILLVIVGFVGAYLILF